MDDDTAQKTSGELKPGEDSEIGPQPNPPQPSPPKPNPPQPPPPQASPAPPTGPPAPSGEPPNTSTVTSSPPRSSKFRIFVIVAVIIILIIYGVVFYLFLENRSLDENSQTTTAETAQLTPTPAFTPDQIQLIAGNVVRVKPSGEETVLIDKKDYTGTGITGFAKVVVSPDNSKICFESWPPAPEPALYIANVDGTGVVEVSPNRQSCVWSDNSSEIYYLNLATGTQSVNIYKFGLAIGEEENLTESAAVENETRLYEIVGLSADSSKLICRYELASIDDAEPNECEIDLTTGEVTILE